MLKASSATDGSFIAAVFVAYQPLLLVMTAPCFVCGSDDNSDLNKLLPVCEGLTAHTQCFVQRQVYNILNTGRCVAAAHPSAAHLPAALLR